MRHTQRVGKRGALKMCFQKELWETVLKGEHLAEALLVKLIILLFDFEE